jgi:Ca2+-binding EF-hand superfamily protein
MSTASPPESMRLSKARLEREFRSHDSHGKGWLSINELRQAYQRYDHYGVVATDTELDLLIESLGVAADGRVTFDEFVLLVLKRARR